MRCLILFLLLVAMVTSSTGLANRGGILQRPIARAVQAVKQSHFAMRDHWKKAVMLIATPVVLCTSIAGCGGVTTSGETETIEQTLSQQEMQTLVEQDLQTSAAENVDDIIIRHGGIIENDVRLFQEEKAKLTADFYDGAEVLYEEDGRVFFGVASIFNQNEPTLIKVHHPMMKYGRARYSIIGDKIIDIDQVLSVKMVSSIDSTQKIPPPDGYDPVAWLAARWVAKGDLIYSFQARQMGDVSFPASAAQVVNNNGRETETRKAEAMLKRAEHLYGKVVVPLSDGRQIVAVNSIKIKGDSTPKMIRAVTARSFTTINKIYVVVQSAVDGREEVTPQLSQVELTELIKHGGVVAPYDW